MTQKYKCDNCDDVFYESNASQASETFVDFVDFDDKDYIICPSCHSSDIEKTDEEVHEVYQLNNWRI